MYEIDEGKCATLLEVCSEHVILCADISWLFECSKKRSQGRVNDAEERNLYLQNLIYKVNRAAKALSA